MWRRTGSHRWILGHVDGGDVARGRLVVYPEKVMVITCEHLSLPKNPVMLVPQIFV